MKKMIFALIPLILMTACKHDNEGQWTNDCMTYHSVNSRELSECKKRVEANRLNQVEPGTVQIDQHNETRDGFNELGKERN